MFTGKFKRRTSTRAYTGPRASHAMESDDYFVVPRGLIEDASVVDLSLDMIAAANEVLEGEVANATFAGLLNCPVLQVPRPRDVQDG